MKNLAYTSNLQTADYRTSTRPPQIKCDVCQVNAATYRKFDAATNSSMNVCLKCKGANFGNISKPGPCDHKKDCTGGVAMNKELTKTRFLGDLAWAWHDPNGKRWRLYCSFGQWRYIRDDHDVSSIGYLTLEDAKQVLFASFAEARATPQGDE